MKNSILNWKAAQKKNQNSQQPNALTMKVSKYQTPRKLSNQNLNPTQNLERKQSLRCQRERHQLLKVKGSPNGLHHICIQDKERTGTLSELMYGFKL
jgi:hypothetical protein